jgi:3D (Asp-Asp-Asp) domain-containing protein
MRAIIFWLACLLFIAAYGPVVCPAFAWEPPSGDGWRSMEVTATAYCSYTDQTSSHPYLGAWDDILVPGMKAIAVSRDLIPMGLGHDTPVYIEGLDGEYRVLDKMNREWRRRIDIYYGRHEKGALDWGKRRVRIYWKPGK